MLTFPTSSARSEMPLLPLAGLPPWPATHLPPRHDADAAHTHHTTTAPPHPESTPAPDHTVSVTHPLVQSCLARARSLDHSARPQHAVVYALAALEVYYSPMDIAHWMFWSPERKRRSAEIVNAVYFHQPALIRSPVAWVGIRESLNLLNNHQAAWRHELALTPWYSIVVPPAAPPPPRVRSIRKCRVVPAPVQQGIPEETDDAPPLKRARTGPSTATEPKSATPTPARKSSRTKKASRARRAPSIPPSTRASTVDQTTPAITPLPLPVAEELDLVQQGPSASSNNRVSETVSPASGQESTSRESSMTVTQDTPAVDVYPRSRSTSLSSASTAISPAGGRRRSLSDLSADTAVGLSAGKGKAADVTIDNDIDPEQSVTEIHVDDPGSSPRRNTRSSARKVVVTDVDPPEVTHAEATAPKKSKVTNTTGERNECKTATASRPRKRRR